jgi:hypothetical protein
MAGEFLGKYRGTVVGTRDPLRLGRVQVEVPEVLGDTRESWAMPCVPYAGPGIGLIAVPPDGANVWVEFEAGDPDRPIWVGCFWGPGELPARVEAPGVAALRVGEVTLVAGDAAPDGTNLVAPAAPGTPGTTTEVTVSGASLVVTRDGDAVLTVDKDTATLRLGSLELALSGTDGTLTLGRPESAVTVAADSVEIRQGSSTARVTGQLVALSSGTASANVSPSALELQQGTARVTLAAGTVDINDGALEVT